MKKIRVNNWMKWKFLKHPPGLKPEQAYKNHFNNLFIYTEELEKYLIDNDIDYEIDMTAHYFTEYKKIK